VDGLMDSPFFKFGINHKLKQQKL